METATAPDPALEVKTVSARDTGAAKKAKAVSTDTPPAT
jgi:hypothetical protein